MKKDIPKRKTPSFFFLKGYKQQLFFISFRIARDQVVLVETAADLCALTSSKRFSRGFFPIFDLGGIKKLLMVQSVIRNNCLGNGSDVAKQCC